MWNICVERARTAEYSEKPNSSRELDLYVVLLINYAHAGNHSFLYTLFSEGTYMKTEPEYIQHTAYFWPEKPKCKVMISLCLPHLPKTTKSSNAKPHQMFSLFPCSTKSSTHFSNRILKQLEHIWSLSASFFLFIKFMWIWWSCFCLLPTNLLILLCWCCLYGVRAPMPQAKIKYSPTMNVYFIMFFRIFNNGIYNYLQEKQRKKTVHNIILWVIAADGKPNCITKFCDELVI